MNLRQIKSLKARFGKYARERIMEYALRGTLLWARVSTPKQARDSENSKQMQMDSAWEFVDELGIPRDVVWPYWAFGESGRKDIVGSKFEEVMERIARDEVGLIVVHEHHRMARKLLRAAQLFELCARMGVVFFIAGDLRDPSDANDLFFLQSLANNAEWQVSAMQEHNSGAKFIAAQELRFRYRLPSGLCWASDEDPAYRERMKHAGLLHWLDPDRLRTYLAKSRWEGRFYYPLPFPDRPVFDSIQLRLQWLLETRSVAAVRRRIVEGHKWGWPAGHDGQTPETQLTRWRPTDLPEWSPVNASHLYRWFRNPALYGIYSYYSVDQEPRRLTSRRKGRMKSVHYGRARQQLRSPLPAAEHLLGVAAASGVQHTLPGIGSAHG